MSNKFKDIDIKNGRLYFFDNMIKVKRYDPNKIKIDDKPYKNIRICYIKHVTFKDLRHIKINSVNPLYLIFNKMNEYFEEISGNKYLTLVTTNESEEIMKKYKEL